MRIGILVLALGLVLPGCSSPASVQRELIIAPAPVACGGAPSATCLKVSEPDGDAWLMRFDEIEGFAYQPGLTWQVLVEEPPVSEELAVVPRLRLVRVLSRQPAATGAPGPLGGATWRLQSISGSPDHAWSDSGITAAFHVDQGWVDGSAGCDRYLAALAVDGRKVTISAPETSRALCAKEAADRQRTYLQALAKAQSYSVTGDRLELTLPDGTMRFAAGG